MDIFPNLYLWNTAWSKIFQPSSIEEDVASSFQPEVPLPKVPLFLENSVIGVGLLEKKWGCGHSPFLVSPGMEWMYSWGSEYWVEELSKKFTGVFKDAISEHEWTFWPTCTKFQGQLLKMQRTFMCLWLILWQYPSFNTPPRSIVDPGFANAYQVHSLLLRCFLMGTMGVQFPLGAKKTEHSLFIMPTLVSNFLGP